MMIIRSLCRSIVRRSHGFSSATQAAGAAINNRFRPIHFSSPSFPLSGNHENGHPFAMSMGTIRSFSDDVTHIPAISDLDIERAFKDLMATNWDELPPSVVEDVSKALTKNTEDKAAQEVLKNVFRAAEAVEEFTGIILSLKMEMDDEIGAAGEDSKPLPEVYVKAMKTILDRHIAYLASFAPEETYLKKKVEMELGSKMIFLKMRCGGLVADWGKVSVLGTSGLAGSYVEQRS